MNKIKRYIVTTLMALAMVLPIIQPLAVHAEETSGQVISITSNYAYEEYEKFYSYTMNIKEGYSEIVGYYTDHYTGSNGVQYKNQCLKLGAYDDEYKKFVDWSPNFKTNWISSYTAHTFSKKDGELEYENFDSQAGLSACNENNFITKIIDGYYTRVNCTWSGIKVFETKEDAQNYVNTGSISGLVEPPKTGLDKEWYLKNIGYSVRAEDGGENEDATFIKFTWDTDNLQDGDLIEIRTHNWYRTLTGSQYSGFHDYITFENGVSAMNGSHEISQYEATNAWFKSLDNTPLVFKSFDTDTYYLRPYRNGVYGGWVRISMKRNPAIKGTPYVNNVEYGDFDEETGDFVIDNDRTQTEGGYGITQKGEPVLPDEYDGLNNVGTVITTAGDALKYFFSNITSVMGLFGQLPQLLNAVIGWLPSPLIVLICASVVVVIILRIFGR